MSFQKGVQTRVWSSTVASATTVASAGTVASSAAVASAIVASASTVDAVEAGSASGGIMQLGEEPGQAIWQPVSCNTH